MHGLNRQNARTEIDTSKHSGNRARQSCGFFTSGNRVMAGRARIQDPQGKAAHRLCSGINLPAASALLAVNPLIPENTMTKHTPGVPALKFHDTKFTITRRDGQPWLRYLQIGDALGYTRPHLLNKLYQKHAAEFTDSMTALVKLKTKGGEQEVRIFSLRGAHLLGMFARTERAAEFRRWVLDILDADTGAEAQRRAKPGANQLTVQPVPSATQGWCVSL